MEATTITKSEEAMAKAIIACITGGDIKVSFFPLYLAPVQVEFINKHWKYAGTDTRSSFIISMFEQFLTKGFSCYTRETLVNQKLKLSLNGIGNNLNQTTAVLRTQGEHFKQRFDAETYGKLLNDIKDSMALIRAIKKMLKSYYKRYIPAASIRQDRSDPKGKKCRPKVKVKLKRIKLYPTDGELIFFREEMKKAEKKQLSAFLRNKLIEKHEDRKFKYRKPVQVDEELQRLVHRQGCNLNKVVHEINTLALIKRFSKHYWEAVINHIGFIKRTLAKIKRSIK